MGKFNVSQQKENELLKRMKELGVFETDISESFVKSGGKGGQNVNKNSTCVHLKHIPTGIFIKYDKERSQLLNRFFARRELISRIESALNPNDTVAKRKANKKKKQKARRKRKTQIKLLKNKTSQ